MGPRGTWRRRCRGGRAGGFLWGVQKYLVKTGQFGFRVSTQFLDPLQVMTNVPSVERFSSINLYRDSLVEQRLFLSGDAINFSAGEGGEGMVAIKCWEEAERD